MSFSESIQHVLNIPAHAPGEKKKKRMKRADEHSFPVRLCRHERVPRNIQLLVPKQTRKFVVYNVLM